MASNGRAGIVFPSEEFGKLMQLRHAYIFVVIIRKWRIYIPNFYTRRLVPEEPCYHVDVAGAAAERHQFHFLWT
jgi:hypothetical protein